MVKDRIEDEHNAIEYRYSYTGDGNVKVISLFDLVSIPGLFSADEPSHQWLFEYDNKGRVSKSTKLTLTSEGLTGFPVTYEYDENGNIVSESYGEGENARVVRYTYEFDDHGNWIRQTGWPVSDDPDVSGYEIVRTISYYE